MVNPSRSKFIDQVVGDSVREGVGGGNSGSFDNFGNNFLSSSSKQIKMDDENEIIIPTPSDNSDSTPAPPPMGDNNNNNASETNKSKGSSSASASSSARVSKACVVCSLKKRRCDGGKPQCKVCMVLGTPCSYESRGLKRGPPKGFRAGPKESAKAKMLRSLETTIRDLTLHMGHSETGKEIARISNERGIKVEMITMHFNGENGQKRARISSIPTVERVEDTKEFVEGSGSAECSGEDDGEDVIGINEQGNLRYIGSSSGINLLQNHTSPSSSNRNVSGTSPLDSNSIGGRHHHHKHSPRSTFSTIQLPTIGQSSSTRTQDSPSSNSAPSSHDISNNGLTGMMDHHLRISRPMNQKLFHHYWTSFHPIWPILYKPALDMIHVDHLPTTLDTALIYSIYAISICVAKPPIDLEVESELGEGPAGEIFAHLAEKFLFYQRDVPTPSFASIQTCFLLSCYYQGAGQLSKAYILSSMANTMAVDLGLHRHLHQYERDLIERESRNRLIHCIYILSTVLCSEMGRPPMLRSKDIDVPPMSESEKDEFETDIHGRQLHSASLLNTSRRLFAIIENVLTQVHSFRRKAALRRMGTEAIRKLVDEIDHSLEVWKYSVPEYLKFPEDVQSTSQKKSSLRINEKDQENPIPSFVAVQIWYYTAQLLLHRPFIPQDEGISLTQLLSDRYHQKCTQNAQSLFDILFSLSKASGVDSLSTDFAYVIFTVAVMFVFNSRLGHSSKFAASADIASKTVLIAGISTRQPVLSYANKLANDSKRQFLMCKEWLRKLSERWPSASSHKLLLDGFTNIGEGVVTGESGHQFMGRRPSIVNGSLIPASRSDKNNNQQQASNEERGGFDQIGQQFEENIGFQNNFTPGILNIQDYSSSGVDTINTSSSEPYPQIQNQFEESQNGTSSQSMPGVIAYSNSVAPQNSLNAYFEFPPNIFDMENVYWNETATRMTPLLGPQTGNGNGGGNGLNVSTPMNSTQNYRMTTSPVTGMYGGNVNVNVNQNQNSNQNFLNSNIPFTPRTLGAFSAISNYANIANHGPPQLPNSSFNVPSNQQQSTNSNIAMGPPPTIRSAVGGQSQSGSSSGNKEPLSNSPGLQMLAQAITSTPDSANNNTTNENGSGGGMNKNTNNNQQQSQTAPIAPSFSPFSFHQEPSAPEWGDVISMLQLPPAFIQ